MCFSSHRHNRNNRSIRWFIEANRFQRRPIWQFFPTHMWFFLLCHAEDKGFCYEASDTQNIVKETSSKTRWGPRAIVFLAYSLCKCSSSKTEGHIQRKVMKAVKLNSFFPLIPKAIPYLAAWGAGSLSPSHWSCSCLCGRLDICLFRENWTDCYMEPRSPP